MGRRARLLVPLFVVFGVFAGVSGAARQNNELPGAKTIRLRQPAPATPPPRRFHLRAPRRVGSGTILFFYGRGWPAGRIVARYRWNRRAWHVFAQRRTREGRYSVKVQAFGRGRFAVRIEFPGGVTGVATIAVA